MYQQNIASLFKDIDRFACLASEVERLSFKTKVYDFCEYPLGLTLFCLGREYASSPVDAFITLFIAGLHYDYDWIYDEASRTNEEQFLIEYMNKSDWEKVLKDQWIPKYFDMSQIHIQEIEKDEFLKKFLWWMPGNVSEEQVSFMNESLKKTEQVVGLYSSKSFYQRYFGFTSDFYFVAESGVYD